MLSTTLVIAALLGLVHSVCDRTLCVDGCGAFDLRLQSCNFDHQSYTSLEKCVCAGIGTPADNEQRLIDCLSCAPNIPGSNTLQAYRVWSVICGVYQEDGEASAIEIDHSSPQSIEEFYSASVLPAVSSACPRAVDGGQKNQPVSPSPVDPGLITMTPSTPTPPTPPASSSASEQSPTPTPSESTMTGQETAVSTDAAAVIAGQSYRAAAIGLVAAAFGGGLV